MIIVLIDGEEYTITATRAELALVLDALSDFRPAPTERKLRAALVATIEAVLPDADDLVPTDEELDDDEEDGDDLLDDLSGG